VTTVWQLGHCTPAVVTRPDETWGETPCAFVTLKDGMIATEQELLQHCPVFLIIRPIPPLAWIPLAILWLGLGDAAKIMVIWFSAFVPSVINSFAGVRTIEPPVLEAARMLGTPSWRFVREVLVPAASPMIFTGLRLSLQATPVAVEGGARVQEGDTGEAAEIAG
jgi:ABC-type proline/glycine betaine transport system permease subunit